MAAAGSLVEVVEVAEAAGRTVGVEEGAGVLVAVAISVEVAVGVSVPIGLGATAGVCGTEVISAMITINPINTPPIKPAIFHRLLRSGSAWRALTRRTRESVITAVARGAASAIEAAFLPGRPSRGSTTSTSMSV